MNFNALYSTRLFGIAGLAVVLLAGCGDSSTPDQSRKGTKGIGLHGRQTLIIHVPDMGERLKLM